MDSGGQWWTPTDRARLTLPQGAHKDRRGYSADRTMITAWTPGGRGPWAGQHYPRSTGEFQSWFASDADCLDYLEWLRWPDGFVCPRCAHAGGWAIGDGRYKCSGREAHGGDRGHLVRSATYPADGVV